MPCFSHLLGVDEEVLRLDVAMDDIVAMAILDGLQQLVDVMAHLVQFNSVWVLLQDFQEVLVQVLKDQVQTVAPTSGQQETVRY